MPRVEDRGAFGRHPEYPRHRGTGCGAHRFVIIPDEARAHQPARVVDAAREIPTAFNAMAAIDGPRTSHRPDRARKSHVGRASCHLPTDIGLEEAHGV